MRNPVGGAYKDSTTIENNIRKQIFTERMVKHQKKLPWEVMESLFLEVLKTCGCDTQGYGLVMIMVGYGCTQQEVFFNFNDSMIL